MSSKCECGNPKDKKARRCNTCFYKSIGTDFKDGRFKQAFNKFAFGHA